MGIGGKARHIQADLCHDHVRGDVTDAGYRAQKPGALLDRRQGFSRAGVELRQGVMQGGHQIQTHLEQSAMVIADTSVQRFHELRAFLAGVTLGEIGKLLWVGLTVDQRLQDGPATLAQYIRQDAPEFQVRILQHLLDARGVLGDLPHQLFAGAGQIRPAWQPSTMRARIARACEVLCRRVHSTSRLFSSVVKIMGSSFGPRRIDSPSISILTLDIEGA